MQGMYCPERGFPPWEQHAAPLLSRYCSHQHLNWCQQQLPAREHVAQAPGCDTTLRYRLGQLPPGVMLRHLAAARGAPGASQPPLDSSSGGAGGAPVVMLGLAAGGASRDGAAPGHSAGVRSPVWPWLHTPQTSKGSCCRAALYTSPPASVSVHRCFSLLCFNCPSSRGCFNPIPNKPTEFLREASSSYEEDDAVSVSTAPPKPPIPPRNLLPTDVQIHNTFISG